MFHGSDGVFSFFFFGWGISRVTAGEAAVVRSELQVGREPADNK